MTLSLKAKTLEILGKNVYMINTKSGGVHQWFVNNWLKGCAVPWYHPLGGILFHVHVYVHTVFTILITYVHGHV